MNSDSKDFVYEYLYIEAYVPTLAQQPKVIEEEDQNCRGVIIIDLLSSDSDE